MHGTEMPGMVLLGLAQIAQIVMHSSNLIVDPQLQLFQPLQPSILQGFLQNPNPLSLHPYFPATACQAKQRLDQHRSTIQQQTGFSGLFVIKHSQAHPIGDEVEIREQLDSPEELVR